MARKPKKKLEATNIELGLEDEAKMTEVGEEKKELGLGEERKRGEEVE